LITFLIYVYVTFWIFLKKFNQAQMGQMLILFDNPESAQARFDGSFAYRLIGLGSQPLLYCRCDPWRPISACNALCESEWIVIRSLSGILTFSFEMSHSREKWMTLILNGIGVLDLFLTTVQYNKWSRNN